MISVAMTTYNGEKYVKEQLESILEQTKPAVKQEKIHLKLKLKKVQLQLTLQLQFIIIRLETMYMY